MQAAPPEARVPNLVRGPQEGAGVQSMTQANAPRLVLSARRAEPRVNATSCGHAFGDRIYHFLAAVHTIAAGEIFGMASLMMLVDSHRAIFTQRDSRDGAQKLSHGLLADGANDHVHIEREFTARDIHELAAARARRSLEMGANTFDRANFSSISKDSDGLRVPVKKDAVEFREIVLIAKRRHFLFATPVNEMHDLSTQKIGR